MTSITFYFSALQCLIGQYVAVKESRVPLRLARFGEIVQIVSKIEYIGEIRQTGMKVVYLFISGRTIRMGGYRTRSGYSMMKCACCDLYPKEGAIFLFLA
jgi:hypothetical protein